MRRWFLTDAVAIAHTHACNLVRADESAAMVLFENAVHFDTQPSFDRFIATEQ